VNILCAAFCARELPILRWATIVGGDQNFNRLKVKSGKVKRALAGAAGALAVDPELQHNALKYRDEIAAMLTRLPRELLLLLKTNDCLRSVDGALGSPNNQFAIMARYCLRGLRWDDAHMQARAYSWAEWWATWPIYARILAFEWWTWWRSIRTCMRSDLTSLNSASAAGTL
jgi:hypothetical protein